MVAAEELAVAVDSTVESCDALGVSRASLYRRRARHAGSAPPPLPRPRPPRALEPVERQHVLTTLHDDRFVDRAPAEAWAALIDEGTYLCSIRTMYRILADADEVRERRDQLRHPAYATPRLVARRPNEVWTWDITKLLGPAKWTYYYLYVLLDLFSRYVVGWMVAREESALLAERLIHQSYLKEGVADGQLTVHADRGPSMTSKTVAHLLADLGTTKTHSRPHVSNDNAFSEAQFKTLKYRPNFPERFGSPEHARSFGRDFFHWYNHEHHHSGLALLTPAAVHRGQATAILEQRQRVLTTAFEAHPERFVNGPPDVARPLSEVWINPPRSNPTPEVVPQTIPCTGPDPGDPPILGGSCEAPELAAMVAGH